ncbi:hypothetical protein M885DRAFT_530203 [Pelagophyceae sp. CCMP2097]|nr:hypothetical protein M885DRAFT_530203 [Pelagophyceae sp. CCMP2097]
MGSKLEFKVVGASGADPDFPADELNRHSPHTRGWQSARFCDYPQEVVLELRARSCLRQVQILSHQHKIATRVELFVGAGARGPEHATWTRLGYLSLDSNERSDFQARELKSVYLECRGRFLKLVVHRCHINRQNLFNQVGLVAVNLLGEYGGDGGDEAAPEVVESGAAGPAARRAPDEVDDLAFDMNVDPRAARQVRALLAAKAAAVAAEDYDAAKRLQHAERQLAQLGAQLAQLEVAKRRAARDEDYDRAKALKFEITALRRRVDDALRACDIDAIAAGAGRPDDDAPARHEPRPPSEPSPGAPPRPAPPPSELEPSPVLRRTAPREESFDAALEASVPAPLSVAASSFGGSPPRGAASTRRPLRNHDDPAPFADTRAQHPDAPLPSPSPPPHDSRRLDDDYPDDAPPPDGDDGADDDDERSLGDSRPPAKGGKPEESGRDALSGVPNCEDLAAPEPLAAPTHVEPSEVSAIGDLLGPYRLRCLFSKNWALREAALAKCRLMVLDGALDGAPHALDRLCDIVRIGVSDKIAQVYLTALGLLEALCSSALMRARGKAPGLLDPAIKVLLAKLGENQPRLRDGALDALATLARCRSLGAAAVAHSAMKSLDAKKHTAHNKWRPIASRLTLLRRLVVDHGVSSGGRGGALQADAVLGFAAAHGCASHTFEEVRTAARDLAVAVYLGTGRDEAALAPYLDKLRPKQVDEYRAAFDRGAPDGDASPGSRRQRKDRDDDDDYDDDAPQRRPPPRDDEAQPSARSVRSTRSSRDVKAPASSRRAPSETPDRPAPPSARGDADARGADAADEDSAADDPEEERFRDQIMKQLEDRAFSVHEAYEILQEHFGDDAGDPVKDAVLLEWVGEIGDVDTRDVDPNNPEHRDKMLMQVATWLFQ